MMGLGGCDQCGADIATQSLCMLCVQSEDKGGSETSMSSCWALLADVVGAAEGAGLRPADRVAYVDALVQVGGGAGMW